MTFSEMTSIQFSKCYQSFIRTLKRRRNKILSLVLFQLLLVHFTVDCFRTKVCTCFTRVTYAVHWLSQVPEGIENNTSNIYMSKSSPPNVLEAYQKQFDIDFRNFLRMRSEELVQGGCMVLSFIGRSFDDSSTDDCCTILELLAQLLQDMLKEGLIQESDINSFNMQFYNPCEDEVKNVIQTEGSFSLDTLNAFHVKWDSPDTNYTNTEDFGERRHAHKKNGAKTLRAVIEPLLTSHFGNSVIDIVFNKFEKHVALRLAKKKGRSYNMVISLSRK